MGAGVLGERISAFMDFLQTGEKRADFRADSGDSINTFKAAAGLNLIWLQHIESLIPEQIFRRMTKTLICIWLLKPVYNV